MQIGEYTNAAGQVFTATFRVIWRVTRLRVNCLVVPVQNVRSASCRNCYLALC